MAIKLKMCGINNAYNSTEVERILKAITRFVYTQRMLTMS